MKTIKDNIRRSHFSISKKLLERSNKYEQIRNINRYNILLFYISFGLLVYAFFTVIDFFTHDYKHFIFVDIPGFIVLPAMLLFVQISRKIALACHLFIIFCGFSIITVFLTGGDYYTGPVFYVVFPIISFFLLGFKSGIIYSFSLLTILAALYMQFRNYSWFPAYDVRQFSPFLVIALIGFLASILYENIVHRYHLSVVNLMERIKRKNKVFKENETKLQIANEKLKETNDELERITKETKELNKTLSNLVTTKDKFFSIISHDLKNPINYLNGFTELLNNRYYTLSDEKKKDYISIIQKSGVSLRKLVEALLEWSKLQTAGITSKPEFIYPHSILQVVYDNLQLAIMEKDITFINLVDTRQKVFADYQMIYSVFRNLISNAIKYSPENGIIKITAEENGDFLKIKFRDNGIGIDKESIDKLFRIDLSFSTPGTHNESGTGMGLILCKEFLEKNNGTIGVESSPGTGSTFWVNLPKANVEQYLLI